MNAQNELLPMTIGERLKLKREELGLTSKDVSEKLKLRAHIVNAIENDQFESLAAVYRRGSILNYAKLVGVDSELIAAELQRLDDSPPELQKVFHDRRVSDFGERAMRMSSYVIFTAIAGMLVWALVQQIVKFSQGESLVPLAGTVDSSDTLTLDAAGQSPSQLNASLVPISLQQPSHPTAAGGDDAWAALKQLSADSSLGGEIEQPTGQAVDQSELRIELSADSWVEIWDADKQRLEFDLLRGGIAKTYLGRSPFQLLLGDAAAANVYLDGQSVDLSQYPVGKVTKLAVGPAE